MDQSSIWQLWQPDLFIYDLVAFDEQAVILPMNFLKLDHTKRLTYLTTARIKLSCRMEFKDFPFDKQLCKFYISSSSYPIEKMVFRSELLNTDTMAYDRLPSYGIEVQTIPKEDMLDVIFDFAWSVTGFQIRFIRHFEQFLLRFFLPCLGMVLVSLISFLIPPEAIPGRIGLLVTLFLVLTTLFGTVQVGSHTDKH